MTTIQFDRLQDVVMATELLPLGSFEMGTVSCGTAGCMIGNYNAMVGRNLDVFGDNDGTNDFEHFGITTNEYCWLFDVYAIGWSRPLATDWHLIFDGIDNVTREAALTRLRKFIAYKRRKHALIHDDKYGVSDAARRAEGNQLFAVLAVQDVLAEPSVAVAG